MRLRGSAGEDVLRMMTSVLRTIIICLSATTALAASGLSLPIEDSSVSNDRDGNFPSSSAIADDAETSGLLRNSSARSCGIQIAPTYYGDVFTNTRGGISTNDATRYLGLLNLWITADFEKLRLPLPGRFSLLGQNTHGQGLTEHFIGDSLVHSDIDSFRNITQVGEYWWELDALEEALTVRLGKQDVNTEFVYMDSAADFVQSSFELSPAEVFPTYPHQSMAAVALLQLNQSLQFKLGVWDALAPAGSWGVSGNGTIFIIGELEYRYALREGALPGAAVVSIARLSEGELNGNAFDAVQGAALQLEQMIYREDASSPRDAQGLSTFLAYYPRSLGTRFLPKAFGDHFTGGLIYRGLVPHRDEDVLGAGLSWVELFQGGSNQETVVELFYKAQLTPKLSVQPDLQYISTPSGIYRDALVAGIRFQSDF
ncbi:MAG: hypothetical protein C0483_00035 [Pirellula sp.]|nr:hypothetical protein [Pirellula sp.]